MIERHSKEACDETWSRSERKSHRENDGGWIGASVKEEKRDGCDAENLKSWEPKIQKQRDATSKSDP